MTSLYTPRNRCQCVSADEPFHLVVDCGFGLFMLLFVALLSRILTLVENPGMLWSEGVLLLVVRCCPLLVFALLLSGLLLVF